MKMFSKIIVFLAVAILAVVSSAPSDYYSGYTAPAYGGEVPSLPPFGVAVRHPAYGYAHGYGCNNAYSNGYVTALRYESNVPYQGSSAYAYEVDGQAVQVARGSSRY